MNLLGYLKRTAFLLLILVCLTERKLSSLTLQSVETKTTTMKNTIKSQTLPKNSTESAFLRLRPLVESLQPPSLEACRFQSKDKALTGTLRTTMSPSTSTSGTLRSSALCSQVRTLF